MAKASKDEEAVLKYLYSLVRMVKEGQLTEFEANINNDVVQFMPLPDETLTMYGETGKTVWGFTLTFIDKEKHDKYLHEVGRR